MVDIYVIRIDEPIEDEAYNQLLLCVSKSKRERIKRFHFIEDAKRTLYGELIVRYLACNILKVPNNKIIINQNEFGKPFLYGYPNFYFNISHSGAWVVCAISKKAVGVDVEVIKPIDLSIAERFFSEIEKQNLLKLEDKSQVEFFYDLWTLKESYIKCRGKGLSIALNSFSIVINNQTVQIMPVSMPLVYLSRIILDNEYKLSVCSEDKIQSSKVKIINIKNIKENLLYGN